jgi:V/A-type H+-transporting ATPase subunit E
MEVQLQELLDRIKSEGIEQAKSQAADIIADAESRKASIVQEAEREARAIIEKARQEAARAEESGRAALSQASRDFLISFREQLERLLAAAVRRETNDAYGPEIMAEAIPVVVKALAAGGTDELSVLLPPAMLARLEGSLPALLGAELKKGVVLKPVPGIEAGFRIVERNGAAYYDFSADAVADIFASRLSLKLAETLRDAGKGI